MFNPTAQIMSMLLSVIARQKLHTDLLIKLYSKDFNLNEADIIKQFQIDYRKFIKNEARFWFKELNNDELNKFIENLD